ncbi:hypothetical protein [Hymenobacter mucosus]|uniref:SpoIIAA-like n=1 Tax=Hymenobacter mucosus TaxID=1411120 RepID=A0A239B5I9_9BACT|nr:hypothetical protein [Hymenobacter mucosus]SNS03140.1 hypothetical protein SAMN06269173_11845 [Hymenobacter mucosus]
MAAPTPAPDYLTLHHRDDLGVLLVRWQRPLSGLEVQAGYEAIATHAVACRSRYWLLDYRGRSVPTEDDTDWFLTQFIPPLAGRLGGRVYLAFLMAPSHLSAIDQEDGVPLASDTHCHLRMFTEEGLAIAWLARRQHYESA